MTDDRIAEEAGAEAEAVTDGCPPTTDEEATAEAGWAAWKMLCKVESWTVEDGAKGAACADKGE